MLYVFAYVYPINIYEHIYSSIVFSQIYPLSLSIFVNIQKIDTIYSSFLWEGSTFKRLVWVERSIIFLLCVFFYV